MNILLLIVAAIFGISVFAGYKKGLIKIVASLLATVIVILLVGLATPYVSQWIRQITPLEESVQSKIAEAIMPETDSEIELTRDEQISSIKSAKLPAMFQQMLLENNNDEVYEALGVSSFIEYAGAYIAKVLADIIAFLIIMVIVLIVLPLIIKTLGIVNKLPVIGGVNRLAGGALGLGIGLAIVWVLFVIITLMYDTSIGKACFENIETNQILTALYDNNLLMKYIIKF